LTVVFLDRDGVINVDRDDYVKTFDEFVFLPGALEGLAKLGRAGATTIIVSNQAGVGRGLIDPAELAKINRMMLETISAHGGEIAGVYYCPHRRDEGCDCRKPETGLLRKAEEELGIESAGAWFIGDAQSDIEAGRRAGCRTILVLTGKASAEDAQSWEHRPDFIVRDLPAAADLILGRATQG
jgi:histidinol-phosphate phosphatase family protein